MLIYEARAHALGVPIEGWVLLGRVNRRGGEAAQDVQFVPGTDGPFGEVGHGAG